MTPSAPHKSMVIHRILEWSIPTWAMEGNLAHRGGTKTVPLRIMDYMKLV